MACAPPPEPTQPKTSGTSTCSCLIIGAGFIGSSLATHLANSGHKVTVFSRSFAEQVAKESISNPRISLVQGSLAKDDHLRKLIDTSDLVFYLAGTSTPASARADVAGSMLHHVIPAATVLDLMSTTSTHRIVIASSGGTIYGDTNLHPTPENHPTNPTTLHGCHSLTIELYADFYSRMHSLETIILRISNPYGPHQVARRGQGVIATWSNALLRDEPIIMFGCPNTKRDFIFIDDLVKGITSAGFDAPRGTYNLGSGKATELGEVAQLLLSYSGKPSKIIEQNRRNVDIPITKLDYSKLQAAVGWNPIVTIAEGIERTWRSFNSRRQPEFDPLAHVPEPTIFSEVRAQKKLSASR